MTQAKPTVAQDLLWRLEALAFDVVIAFARMLPVDLVSDFGSWFFRTLGPLTGAPPSPPQAQGLG